MAHLTFHDALPGPDEDFNSPAKQENDTSELGICSASCVYEVQIKTNLSEEEAIDLVHSELSGLFNSFYSGLEDDQHGIRSCELVEAAMEGMTLEDIEDDATEDQSGGAKLSSLLSFHHSTRMLYDQEEFEEALASVARKFSSFIDGKELGTVGASLRFNSEDSLKEFVLHQIYNQYAARKLADLAARYPALFNKLKGGRDREISAVLTKFSSGKIPAQTFSDVNNQDGMNPANVCRAVAGALASELRSGGHNSAEIKGKLDGWIKSTPYVGTGIGQSKINEALAESQQEWDKRGIGQRAIQKGDPEALNLSISIGADTAKQDKDNQAKSQAVSTASLENRRKMVGQQGRRGFQQHQCSDSPSPTIRPAGVVQTVSSSKVKAPSLSDDDKRDVYSKVAKASSHMRLATFHQMPKEMQYLMDYFDEDWFDEFDYAVDMYRTQYGKDPTGFEMEDILLETTEKFLKKKDSTDTVVMDGQVTRPYDLQIDSPMNDGSGDKYAKIIAHVKAYHNQSATITLRSGSTNIETAKADLRQYFAEVDAFINYTYADLSKVGKHTVDPDNASTLRMDFMYPQAIDAIIDQLDNGGFNSKGVMSVKATLPFPGGGGEREVEFDIKYKGNEMKISGSDMRNISLAVYTHEGMSASYLHSAANATISNIEQSQAEQQVAQHVTQASQAQPQPLATA